MDETQLNESPAADVAKQHFFDPVVDISPIFSPSHPGLPHSDIAWKIMSTQAKSSGPESCAFKSFYSPKS